MTTFFFRNDELTIPSNRACICDIMENTRHNESLRETFKWVPDSCMLESFDGKDFCNVLGKKRLLLVGDSLMHQLASTLYNTLKTLNAPPTVPRSDFLWENNSPQVHKLPHWNEN